MTKFRHTRTPNDLRIHMSCVYVFWWFFIYFYRNSANNWPLFQLLYAISFVIKMWSNVKLASAVRKKKEIVINSLTTDDFSWLNVYYWIWMNACTQKPLKQTVLISWRGQIQLWLKMISYFDTTFSSTSEYVWLLIFSYAFPLKLTLRKKMRYFIMKFADRTRCSQW